MLRTCRLFGIASFILMAAQTARAQDEGYASDSAAVAESQDEGLTPDEGASSEKTEMNGAVGVEQAVGTVPVESIKNDSSPALTVDSSQKLDEVVVTATRREASIGRVPIAIAEISGQDLENNIIRDTQSLVMQAPSLSIQFSGSEANATIRIRGIGTGGSNAGFESSVGVFVDGVYLPRPGLALTDLVDIDRIEVLRGPQGTLFGKNTTVGAIHLLTKAPGYNAEADIRVSGGSFNSRVATAVLGGPLIDNVLSVRLSGQYNERDGYVLNQFNNEYYNDRHRYLVRAQALLNLSDDATLRLIGTRNNKKERCCVAPYTAYNPAAADNIEAHGGTVFEPPQEYTVAFDYTDTFSNAGEDSYSAHLDWFLDGIRAKALVSYSKGFADDKRDGDFSDVDFAYQPFVNAQTEITTSELSFQGTYGILDWVGGAFYSDETIGAQAQTLLGEDAGSFLLGNGYPPGEPVPLYPAGSGNLAIAYQDGTSASIFTHNVLNLGAGFDATLGLRYLVEEKTGGGYADSDSPSCTVIPLVPGGTVPAVPGVADPTRTTNSLRALCGADAYNQRYEDKRITGTVALGKLFDGGLYTYGSYSRGFKAGGINLNPPSTVGGTFQFRPELIDNYEIGLRIPFFDGALSTRATFFYMDLRDYQVNAFDGTAFTVSNAGHVTAEGVEFESTLRAGAHWSFKANYTYTEALYAEGTAPIGTGSTSVIGKQLTNSPENVGQLSVTFNTPLPWNMELFSTLSARYQSEVNTGVDLNPGKDQEAYALLNGRLGLRFGDTYEMVFSGANLTDQYYRQIIFDSVTRPPVGAEAEPRSFNGYPGTPRMLAIELRARF